jgi:hypothetical protein
VPPGDTLPLCAEPDGDRTGARKHLFNRTRWYAESTPKVLRLTCGWWMEARLSTGTVAGISLPPRPRQCDESWLNEHVASTGLSAELLTDLAITLVHLHQQSNSSAA